MDIAQLEPEKIKDLPHMEVGNVLLFKSKESSIEGPVFYIKEDISKVSKTLPKISIQLKDIVINWGYSSPLMLMVKLNNDDNLIYGQWFNKYNNTDRELFKEILFQDKLNFCIVDRYNNCKIRFNYTNIYKKAIWGYFKINENDRKWSQKMYESDIIAITETLESKAQLFNL